MVVASCAPSPLYWTGLVQWRSCWLVTEEKPVSKYWRYISYCDFCFSVFLQYHRMWQNSSTVNMARPLLFAFLYINLSWLPSHPCGSCVRLRNSGDGENLVLPFYYINCWRHISCHVSVASEGGEGRGQEERGVLFNPLNPELNPICHFLILLGDLTFMGTCIISIFQYTCISNKMQRYTAYLYL
jgi:hypothetical protein